MKIAPALPLTLALIGILSGCAGIGKQNFACSGYPSKPLCLSTSEVYWLTDGDPLPQGAMRPRPVAEAPRSDEQPLLETP